MRDTERRRHRRFELHHAATLRPAGNPVLHGIVENASLGGSLFICDMAINPGTSVQVTISLTDAELAGGVRLRASGNVVWVQADSNETFRVAVAYEEPLAQG
jgi:hypothetical protein